MPKKLTIEANPDKGQLTGGLTQVELKEQLKALEKSAPKWIPADEILIRYPFAEAFRAEDKDYQLIRANMEQNGFRQEHPLFVMPTPEGFVLLDGHRRFRAAQELKHAQVPVLEFNFEDDSEALHWIYTLQFHRRNLNDSTMLEWIINAVRYHTPEADYDTEENRGLAISTTISAITPEKAPKGRSRQKERIADLLGISDTKAMKLLVVTKQASQQQTQAILDGEETINSVYTEIMEATKPKKEEIQEVENEESLPGEEEIEIDAEMQSGVEVQEEETQTETEKPTKTPDRPKPPKRVQVPNDDAEEPEPQVDEAQDRSNPHEGESFDDLDDEVLVLDTDDEIEDAGQEETQDEPQVDEEIGDLEGEETVDTQLVDAFLAARLLLSSDNFIPTDTLKTLAYNIRTFLPPGAYQQIATALDSQQE